MRLVADRGLGDDRRRARLPGQRAGADRGPARHAVAGAKGAAAGRSRGRQGVLGGRARGDGRRRRARGRARPARALAQGARPPRAAELDGRRERVRVLARPRPRRRVRRRSRGPRARGSIGEPQRGSRRRPASASRTSPTCSPTTTRRRSSSRARPATAGSNESCCSDARRMLELAGDRAAALDQPKADSFYRRARGALRSGRPGAGSAAAEGGRVVVGLSVARGRGGRQPGGRPLRVGRRRARRRASACSTSAASPRTEATTPRSRSTLERAQAVARTASARTRLRGLPPAAAGQRHDGRPGRRLCRELGRGDRDGERVRPRRAAPRERCSTAGSREPSSATWAASTTFANRSSAWPDGPVGLRRAIGHLNLADATWMSVGAAGRASSCTSRCRRSPSRAGCRARSGGRRRSRPGCSSISAGGMSCSRSSTRWRRRAERPAGQALELGFPYQASS